MRPSFYPRLINNPLDDPGLFIPFMFEKRALLFDLGDLHALSGRDILKISHIFVTHTHMDHFIGFDHLLRLFLGREKRLHLYGPEGILNHVQGKLAGYAWNLVDNFSADFSIQVTEVRESKLLTNIYRCRDRFRPEPQNPAIPFNGILLQEPAFKVQAIVLDHGIPCLGFSLRERFHINIRKERLEALGLETGPWLKDFKAALYEKKDSQSTIEIPLRAGYPGKRSFALKDLADEIALITAGQKITYVADAAGSDANVHKIETLAKASDQLFIEAAFLEKDRDIAAKKMHLTAWQAGKIAGQGGVKQMTPFHFSPRYIGQEHLVYEEADRAYQQYRPLSSP